MSVRSFESLILHEAREVIGKRGLRQKDIQEWSTAEVKPQAGERTFRLPRNGVWIAVKEENLPKAPQSTNDREAMNKQSDNAPHDDTGKARFETEHDPITGSMNEKERLQFFLGADAGLQSEAGVTAIGSTNDGGSEHGPAK